MPFDDCTVGRRANGQGSHRRRLTSAKQGRAGGAGALTCPSRWCAATLRGCVCTRPYRGSLTKDCAQKARKCRPWATHCPSSSSPQGGRSHTIAILVGIIKELLGSRAIEKLAERLAVLVAWDDGRLLHIIGVFDDLLFLQ